jgi:hypothetical protein
MRITESVQHFYRYSEQVRQNEVLREVIQATDTRYKKGTEVEIKVAPAFEPGRVDVYA